MREIAAEHGVDWDAKSLEAEISKMPQDLLVCFKIHLCLMWVMSSKKSIIFVYILADGTLT
jgi:hypothetical protein